MFKIQFVLASLLTTLSVAPLADTPMAPGTCSETELNQQKEVMVEDVPRTALCLQRLADQQPIWVLMDDRHPLYINKRAFKAKGDDIIEEIESKTQQILESENVQQLLDGYKDLMEELLKDRDDDRDKPQMI